MSQPSLRIQLRGPAGERQVLSVASTMTLAELKQEATKRFTTLRRPTFSVGFPPVELTIPQGETEITAAITNLQPRGVKSGDVILVEEKGVQDTILEGKGGWKYPPSIPANRGCFFRRRIPGDNSCLFHSVHYALVSRDLSVAKARSLRELAANIVASDPVKWDTATLGMSNKVGAYSSIPSS